MERNLNETPTNHTPGQSAASGSGAAPLSESGYGASSGSSSSGSTSSSGSFGGESGINTGEIADRAKGALSGAREKAGNVKNILADKLEAGAERLQQRGQGNQYAGAGAAGGDGSISVQAENRLTAVTSSVASGMQETADWLREADLESLKEGVEQQVKEHPGRTLLIALGVGYLLGKAFRR